MLLKVENFKCHKIFNEKICNLTVFCGKNGTGKSTIIQALMLYNYTSRLIGYDNKEKFNIPLNGPYSIYHGTAEDIIGNFSDSVNTSEVTIDGLKIIFFPEERSEGAEFIVGVPDKKTIQYYIDKIGKKYLSKNFIYLSAERVGPRLIPSIKQCYEVDNVGVGVKGEYCAEFLKKVQLDKIEESLYKHAKIESEWIKSHLEYWMSKLFGHVQIKVVDNGQFAPPSIQFLKRGLLEEWVHATNQGFGITYALPIVLACLTSNPGDLLIIDSPEAHLHPAAQTGIAEFLGMIAGNGRNVIIETHSDHVIDGFRIAVADKNISELTPDTTKILFFSQNESGESTVDNIGILKDGSLTHWPSEFFDQMSLNLRKLSEYKRRVRNK